MLTLTWRTKSSILKSYKPKPSNIMKGKTLKYQEFRNKTPYQQDLKNNVIEICYNCNIIIIPADIEGCHPFPLGQ